MVSLSSRISNPYKNQSQNDLSLELEKSWSAKLGMKSLSI